MGPPSGPQEAEPLSPGRLFWGWGKDTPGKGEGRCLEPVCLKSLPMWPESEPFFPSAMHPAATSRAHGVLGLLQSGRRFPQWRRREGGPWRSVLKQATVARISGAAPPGRSGHRGCSVDYPAHWPHFSACPRVRGDRTSQLLLLQREAVDFPALRTRKLLWPRAHGGSDSWQFRALSFLDLVSA